MMCAVNRYWLLVLAANLILPAPLAQAGLFDDDEARQQISELRSKTTERFETQARAQLELANQIEALKTDLAKLRGLMETLSYELESSKKRQQDFYVDLDSRVRKLETHLNNAVRSAASAEAAATTVPSTITVPDSNRNKSSNLSSESEESRDYEAGLNQFKAGKYKEAASAFAQFVKTHPEHELAPSAQYWLGNAYYGLRDCKNAAEAHRILATRWPEHAKAPDALLNMAACQQELGNVKGARQTLETLASKYPNTAAGDAASKRLKK